MKAANSIFLTLFLMAATLFSCNTEEVPEFITEPPVETKTLNLIFIDKADPTANMAIYINNDVVRGGVLGGLFGNTKGLQQVRLPDSLINRTLTITLAESADPPAKLRVQDLVYETFILPSEQATVSTVAFVRDNAASPIATYKSGLASTEPAPDPGYFKIRFFNLTTGKLDVFNRSGVPYQNLADLDVVEERAFQQLPFGSYRFTVRKQTDGSVLGTAAAPVVEGQAGKIYNVLCTDDGQAVTELGDYGVPESKFAHVAYINLLPKTPQVWALPLAGSTRKEATPKQYAKFDGIELVQAGNQTITVEVGQEKLTANYELRPYDYLMVMVVDNYGKPELRLVLTPMTEPNGTSARFFNFTSDTAQISFGRIRTDVVLTGLDEPPATVLDLTYASNLKFGEIRTKNESAGTTNVNASFVYKDLGDGALILQAYDASEFPSQLGEPIKYARADYPFTAVPASNYTVVLTGTRGEENPEWRPKITVISHSF